MDFSLIKYFNKTEFYGQIGLLEPAIVFNLDRQREALNQRIYISPANGAIARYSGSKISQHYIGESPNKIVRKSTAIDVFIEGLPFENFIKIYRSDLFTGIGIYLDTTGVDGKPWVMFHLDLRDRTKNTPLIWVCTKTIEPNTQLTINDYHYPQSNVVHWGLLNRKIFFQERVLD